MLRPNAKVRDNGRVRACFEMKPAVYDLLKKITEHDHRSMLAELTYLIEERARALDIPRHVGKQGREGNCGIPSVPPALE